MLSQGGVAVAAGGFCWCVVCLCRFDQICCVFVSVVDSGAVRGVLMIASLVVGCWSL